MSWDRRYSNTYFYGTVSFLGSVSLPAGMLYNSHIATLAAIDAEKVVQQRSIVVATSGTVATFRRAVLRATGAGEVVGFSAGSRVVCIGDSTVTVDLLKNGTTMLSSVITLDSSNVAYTGEDGTVSVASFVADDILEINVVATVGTGTLAVDFFTHLVINETAG